MSLVQTYFPASRLRERGRARGFQEDEEESESPREGSRRGGGAHVGLGWASARGREGKVGANR